MRSLLLASITAALLLPATAFGQPPSYLFQWGSYGTAAGQFNFPVGVAIDASGNVYVADEGNGRVQVFTSAGAYLAGWAGECGGGIAISDAGTLYLGGNLTVRNYTTGGVLLNQWSTSGCNIDGACGPSGIAIDASGNVFLADQVLHCIWKYDAGGQLLTRWGSYGRADGQFGSEGPVRVAVDENGNVFATDPTNSRVQKFANDGTHLASFGHPGSGPVQYYQPVGIASDRRGHIYVSVFEPSRIQEFTTGGSFVTEWGAQGRGDGQLLTAHSLAVDASGRVYVADSGNNRIEVFGEQPTPTRRHSWGSLKTRYH